MTLNIGRPFFLLPSNITQDIPFITISHETLYVGIELFCCMLRNISASVICRFYKKARGRRVKEVFINFWIGWSLAKLGGFIENEKFDQDSKVNLSIIAGRSADICSDKLP